MSRRKSIVRALTVFYSDTGLWRAHVVWSDLSITVGHAFRRQVPKGEHMRALFDRARRDGIPIEHESR